MGEQRVGEGTAKLITVRPVVPPTPCPESPTVRHDWVLERYVITGKFAVGERWHCSRCMAGAFYKDGESRTEILECRG